MISVVIKILMIDITTSKVAENRKKRRIKQRKKTQ